VAELQGLLGLTLGEREEERTRRAANTMQVGKRRRRVILATIVSDAGRFFLSSASFCGSTISRARND